MMIIYDTFYANITKKQLIKTKNKQKKQLNNFKNKCYNYKKLFDINLILIIMYLKYTFHYL